MSCQYSALLVLATSFLPGAVQAQDCPENVAGRSIAGLIAEHGGALDLFNDAEDEIAVIEFLLDETQNALDPSNSDPDVVAAIEELTANLETQQKISEAALCHAGG